MSSGIGTLVDGKFITSSDPSSLPQPSNQSPPATALDSKLGVATEYARADHTHAARVQRTSMITDSNGLVTWTFARPIVCLTGAVPPISYMVEDTGTPVVVQITSRTFTSSGGNDTHTAVTVKAQRSRTLPAALVSLSALLNFDIFGTVASAVKINLFAADPTQ
jgi:hypothetical protein